MHTEVKRGAERTRSVVRESELIIQIATRSTKRKSQRSEHNAQIATLEAKRSKHNAQIATRKVQRAKCHAQREKRTAQQEAKSQAQSAKRKVQCITPKSQKRKAQIVK